jgi:hypothetical protein
VIFFLKNRCKIRFMGYGSGHVLIATVPSRTLRALQVRASQSLLAAYSRTYTCPNGRAGPAWTRHDTPVSRVGPGWHVGPNSCPGTARQLLIGPGRARGTAARWCCAGLGPSYIIHMTKFRVNRIQDYKSNRLQNSL